MVETVCRGGPMHGRSIFVSSHLRDGDRQQVVDLPRYASLDDFMANTNPNVPGPETFTTFVYFVRRREGDTWLEWPSP